MSSLPEREHLVSPVNVSFETPSAAARTGFAATLRKAAGILFDQVLLPAVLGLRAPGVRETLRSLDDRNLALLGIDRRDLKGEWSLAEARPVRLSGFAATATR